RKAVKELLSRKRDRSVGAGGKGDVAFIGAFKLSGRQRLQIVARLFQTLSQLFERLFGVRRRGDLDMGKPRTAFGSEIASELNLARQRQHVRIKPRAEQHLRLNILRLAMRFCLGEKARETAEDLQEGRNGSVVEGHGLLFRWLRKVMQKGKVPS